MTDKGDRNTRIGFERIANQFDGFQCFLCAAQLENDLCISGHGGKRDLLFLAIEIVKCIADRADDTEESLLCVKVAIDRLKKYRAYKKEFEAAQKYANRLNTKEKAPKAARAAQGAEK